jgi:hypothetical protein
MFKSSIYVKGDEYEKEIVSLCFYNNGVFVVKEQKWQ